MVFDQIYRQKSEKGMLHGPRLPRPSVLLLSSVERPNRLKPSIHRIRNVTCTGARIDNAADFEINSTISLSIGMIKAVDAVVIWRIKDNAGLAFKLKIPSDLISNLFDKYKNSCPANDFQTCAMRVTKQLGWIGNLKSPYGAGFK